MLWNPWALRSPPLPPTPTHTTPVLFHILLILLESGPYLRADVGTKACTDDLYAVVEMVVLCASCELEPAIAVLVASCSAFATVSLLKCRNLVYMSSSVCKACFS